MGAPPTPFSQAFPLANSLPIPPVVLIGPGERPEFAALAALLRRRTCCLEFPSPAAALHAGRLRFPSENESQPWSATDEPPPEPLFGVLFEAAPGVWSPTEAARLAARWPLCGWTTIFADACSGDERAGRALPGVRRLPWQRACLAFDLDLWDLSAGRLPRFQRPASYTAEDHALADAAAPLPQSEGQAVVAARGQAGEDLVASLRACGWKTRLWMNGEDAQSAELLIGDLDSPPAEAAFSSIAAGRWSGVWAAGSFLRFAEAASLRRTGVDEVLAKSFTLRELGLRLARFAERSPLD